MKRAPFMGVEIETCDCDVQIHDVVDVGQERHWVCRGCMRTNAVQPIPAQLPRPLLPRGSWRSAIVFLLFFVVLGLLMTLAVMGALIHLYGNSHAPAVER